MSKQKGSWNSQMCRECGHLIRKRNRYGGHASTCSQATPVAQYEARKRAKKETKA